MPESNVELARRGFAAALNGDFETLTGILDPDVKWHGGDPTATDACHNRDQALAVMRRSGFLRARSAEVVDVIEAGDKVVVILRPSSQAAAPVANLATFRDGRVVEMVHYPDPAAALAAAGAGV